jgi:hypothetical protein
VRLHGGVDAVFAGKAQVLRAVGLVPPPVGLQIDLIGDVEVRLPVLDGAGTGVRQVEEAQLGQ